MTPNIETPQIILEREHTQGRSSLSTAEVDIFHIYRFLCEFESGGLIGLLYNLSPDFSDLLEVSNVVKRLNHTELHSLLNETFRIVEAGSADFQGTWSEWILTTNQPERLEAISTEIDSIYEVLWVDLAAMVDGLTN